MRSLPLVLAFLGAAGSAAAEPRASDPLAEARGDLDGKRGHDTVRLLRDGTLTAGDATLAVELHQPGTDDNAEVSDLKVISLGGRRRGVMLVTTVPWGEDEPDRSRVFLYQKGALVLVFDEQRPGLRFSAKGTGRYLEGFGETCDGKKDDARAKVHAVALRLNRKGTEMIRTRAPSRRVISCDYDAMSACPFVYELDDGTPWFAGEILRNLRGSPAYALQSLGLRTQTAGTARLRLSEEKPEVTYLDEIYLVVDGTRVAPTACRATPAPAYCVADHRYHVMAEGDTLELELDVPAGPRSLFARGFYIPN